MPGILTTGSIRRVTAIGGTLIPTMDHRPHTLRRATVLIHTIGLLCWPQRFLSLFLLSIMEFLARQASGLRRRNPALAGTAVGRDRSLKLPSELWECVSNHLDDTTLLVTAARSVYIPPITRLSCMFGPTDDLLRGLRILLDVVKRSNQLPELDLEFPSGAFYETKQFAATKALHNVFYDVLQSMSAKAADTLAFNYHVCTISSVRIRSHRGASEWYTVIFSQKKSQLTVCVPDRDHFPSVDALDAILRHLTVCDLKYLSILRDITPQTLGTLIHFLTRHPSLEDIDIAPVPNAPTELTIRGVLPPWLPCSLRCPP
ncbi:hypothetical protein DFH06DRAFT_1371623 [Mycena polygramma]|nr:hypothetical protein DFH06DRAFT_1371623 [Mycena polygramma]